MKVLLSWSSLQRAVLCATTTRTITIRLFKNLSKVYRILTIFYAFYFSWNIFSTKTKYIRCKCIKYLVYQDPKLFTDSIFKFFAHINSKCWCGTMIPRLTIQGWRKSTTVPNICFRMKRMKYVLIYQAVTWILSHPSYKF